MSDLQAFVRSYFQQWIALWDQFWFTPTRPHTLAAIRVATGIMLVYAHIVLANQLMAFIGPDAWVNAETVQRLHENDSAWSYLWHIQSPAILWAHHVLTLLVMVAFTCGFLTRLTAPAAWLLQLMYMHRLTGALFGFDQMVTMLVMYLMLSPCGSVWSVDAWLRGQGRAGRLFPDASPSVSANVATRLLQLHLCVIYLFGGVSKMRGEMWWDGTALWFAVSNYEYQSLDMTWIARFPIIFAALSHLTIVWETFYCALVWPKLTRPIVIAIAFMVHGGIAISLGMITFGVTMIIANCIFIAPSFFRRFDRQSAASSVSGSGKTD